MKLQTQFTVPHKQLRDLDYVKEIEILETRKDINPYVPQIRANIVAIDTLSFSPDTYLHVPSG